MKPLALKTVLPYAGMIGVGGIGTGLFFALEGNATLGRNESRPGHLLDVRDYCKLHIISHYLAKLLGAGSPGSSFRVLPIGKVGADPAGRRLMDEMRDAGVDLTFVETVPDRPTLLSVCFQYPDGSGGNITTSESAASTLAVEEVDRALDPAPMEGGGYVALAVPEAPLAARRRLLERATEQGAFRAGSFTTAEIAAARSSGMLGMLDLLSMNEDEAQLLSGMPLDPVDPLPLLRACEQACAAQRGDVSLVVTAGKLGAFGYFRGKVDYCPAVEVAVESTAGAGDALLSGVIAGLIAGLPLIIPRSQRKRLQDRPLASALDFGVLVAGFSVTSPHTIHPDLTLDSVVAFADSMGITLDGELRSRFTGGSA